MPPALPKKLWKILSSKTKSQQLTLFSYMEIKDKLEVSGRIGSVEKIFAVPPALPKKSWKNQVQSPTNFVSYMEKMDKLEVRER